MTTPSAARAAAATTLTPRQARRTGWVPWEVSTQEPALCPKPVTCGVQAHLLHYQAARFKRITVYNVLRKVPAPGRSHTRQQRLLRVAAL